MDFGALPPEINSGLMYAGPGPASTLAAATAWEGLAAELRSAAIGYGSVVLELSDAGWQGPSSAAMAAAAAPYVAWMHLTAAQAEQAGMQAAAAAAAHEAAFVATVPPPVIAANRALLMMLMATNFLGQNTPAIATTEAQYAEMWAQDAAAMYAYAASSTAAAMLTPMSVAPRTANEAGLGSGAMAAAGNDIQGAAQGIATQAAMGLTGMPSGLNASAPTLVSSLQSGLGSFASLLGTPLSQGAGMGTSGLGGMTAPNAGLEAPMRAPGVVMRPQMPNMERLVPAQPTMVAPETRTAIRLMPAATMGQATPVGGLSVPSSWTPATPEAAAPSAAPLSSAGSATPMLAPRGLPASQVGGMEMRGFGTAVPARQSVLPRVFG